MRIITKIDFSLVTQLVKDPPAMQETPVRFLGQEDPTPVFLGFPGGSDSKESAYNVGDLGSIPGLGRSLGEGMKTHSSILVWRIPMDCSCPWGHKESDKTEQLSTAQYRKKEYGIWK